MPEPALRPPPKNSTSFRLAKSRLRRLLAGYSPAGSYARRPNGPTWQSASLQGKALRVPAAHRRSIGPCRSESDKKNGSPHQRARWFAMTSNFGTFLQPEDRLIAAAAFAYKLKFSASERRQGYSGKLLLAIFRKVYYTKQASCRCDGMVDVVDSKSTAGDSVPVRVRSPAPQKPRN